MSFTAHTRYKLNIDDLILDNVGKRYVLKVKDLAEDDKPREKLVSLGPASLTSPELLAIILSTGTKKEEVLSMATRILKDYGEKSIALQTSPKQIAAEFNIPLIKACQIAACFELGRRFFKGSRNGIVTLRTAKQTYEYVKSMGDLAKEHLRGIYLNSHYRVIHDEVISVGSLTANIVHPREVFRPAIEYTAAALIIVHNHPSGTIKPTASDIEITEQLIRAGKILGIELLDHVIIGKNKYFSIPANYE